MSRGFLACQALNSNGRRCGSKVRVVAVEYHGSHELYAFHEQYPRWVRVYLCPKHRPGARPGARRTRTP